MGKWSQSFKEKYSSPLPVKSGKVDIDNVIPKVSTMSPGAQRVLRKEPNEFITASTMSPMTWGDSERKKQELRNLIVKVSKNYGGDDPAFLAEYIEDVLKDWEHDLDTALNCFRDLAKQVPPEKNRN